MTYKILVVEDDPILQRELVTLLQGAGYEAQAVTDFSATLSTLAAFDPHLVLLDIKLPGQSGFSLCSQIRAQSSLPIVFVTGCATDMDELSSILLGGDAFVTKPYNTAILLAKIDALLKRAYPRQPETRLTHQGVTLHLDSSKVTYGQGEAQLTKTECKLLFYLFQHAGAICPRGALTAYLWDNQLYVDDNALSVNIRRIREKLAALGLTEFIKTKHRQGYTL